MMGTNNQYTPYIQHDGAKLYSSAEQEPVYRRHWESIFSADDPAENYYNHDHIETIEQFMQDRRDRVVPFHHGDLGRLDPVQCPPIAMVELNLVIAQAKHKAPGPNKITAHQLKNLPSNYRKLLLHIFNQSLSAGYFPDVYKKAEMILIPKSGTPGTSVKDKRPISLLNVDGKLLDKILNRRFTDYLEDNDMTNCRQHGFRAHRGTQTAIATLHESIARHLGQRHRVDMVCRDVSKAFDRIWHTGLKYKLTETGLHDCYIRLLCDYLTDRTAAIKLGQFIGPEFELETGVPQGASLSPTLFNFYVKDLPTPVENSDYIQYADDVTQIIGLPGPPEAIAQNTTIAIAALNNFENNWKIQTNISKFKIVKLARKKTGNVRVGDHFVPYTNSAKVLGLNYTTTGLKVHVNQRRAIAQTTLNRLKRFSGLGDVIKRKLYVTMVRPQLLYPIVPLNGISKTAKLKLQKVQNDALRFIDGSTRMDRIPSHRLHNRHDLEAINAYLHRLSIKVWTDMRRKNPDIYDRLRHRPGEPVSGHAWFPTTYVTEDSVPPGPLYV